jgi:hypothetical protein
MCFSRNRNILMFVYEFMDRVISKDDVIIEERRDCRARAVNGSQPVRVAAVHATFLLRSVATFWSWSGFEQFK